MRVEVTAVNYKCDAPGCGRTITTTEERHPVGWVVAGNMTACPNHADPLSKYSAERAEYYARMEVFADAQDAAYNTAFEQWGKDNPAPAHPWGDTDPQPPVRVERITFDEETSPRNTTTWTQVELCVLVLVVALVVAVCLYVR